MIFKEFIFVFKFIFKNIYNIEKHLVYLRKFNSMTITDKAINKLKEDRATINELAAMFRKSELTIKRWLESKDTRLTTFDAVKYIKAKTGLSQAEILN